MNLWDNLIANYKMNDGWTDSSVNSYDGTASGATIDNINQKLGSGCGKFDGIDDRITFVSSYNPTGKTQLSIDGWIKNDAGGFSEGIFGWYGDNKGIFIQSSHISEGLLVLAGTNADWGRVPVDITTDWSYFALVYDGNLVGNNRLKLYYNGVQQSLIFNIDAVIPAALPTISGTPEIGNAPTLSRYWDGFIDDLAVYDHALTQNEIDWRYNGGEGQEIVGEIGIFLSRGRLINMDGTLGGLTKSTLNNLGGI